MPAKEKRSKRESGKQVVLNEEELIRQVELRPILYDKSLKGYRKSALRFQYWKEVGQVVGATVEECRRRWRSLRDAFSKHYKYLNRIEHDATQNKRKKWVFYDQMIFMAHYLENAFCEIEDTLLEDFPDNSDDDNTMMLNEAAESCRLAELDSVDAANLHIEVDEKPNTTTQSQSSTTAIGDDSQFIASILHSSTAVSSSPPSIPIISAAPAELVKEIYCRQPAEEMPTNSSSSVAMHMKEIYCRQPAEEMPTNSSSSSSVAMCLDSDEKFLMSCAPILRRLSHRKNALARLKIQQILYNIEFETDER